MVIRKRIPLYGIGIIIETLTPNKKIYAKEILSD